MTRFEKLSSKNVENYLDYLKISLEQEPDMMTIDSIDKDEIRNRIMNNKNTSISILAIEDEQVIGRIEYHFYDCIQDGYKMAYVNWIYVLPVFRHKGVAQSLFKEFENDCMKNGINQYFLIQACNENATHFYGSFEGSATTKERILRKTIKE